MSQTRKVRNPAVSPPKGKTTRVFIRFLRQGLVEAEAPENFDQITAQEKLSWATEQLAELTDDQIIEAMADFETPKENGYFDEPLEASAVEKAEPQEEYGEIIVQTREWEIFSNVEGIEIVESQQEKEENTGQEAKA